MTNKPAPGVPRLSPRPCTTTAELDIISSSAYAAYIYDTKASGSENAVKWFGAAGEGLIIVPSPGGSGSPSRTSSGSRQSSVASRP